MLSSAVESGHVDHRAIETCGLNFPNAVVEAAINSTAAEVRGLARSAPRDQDPNLAHLPKNGSAFVAICISAVPKDSELGKTASHFALWESNEHTGVLAVW